MESGAACQHTLLPLRHCVPCSLLATSLFFEDEKRLDSGEGGVLPTEWKPLFTKTQVGAGRSVPFPWTVGCVEAAGSGFQRASKGWVHEHLPDPKLSKSP